MAIVITKKLRTILLIVLGVLVLGGGGYLLWRINQEETVAPSDSDAACEAGCTNLINQNVWLCSDLTGPTSGVTGCYKIQSCGTGYDANCQCYSPCGSSTQTCSNSRVASDMSQPTEHRCLEKGAYTYECGTYCYLPSMGPTCCVSSSYTIKYVASTGGTISGSATQTLAKDKTTSSVTAVADTGYTFTQWSDGSTSASRTDKVSGNATYTATFTANQYTVTYDANGGTCTPSTRTVDYGTISAAPTCTYTGFNLSGFKRTTGSGGTLDTLTGAITKVSGDQTIQALWSENCGDGVCSTDENANTCPIDCEADCGDGVCNGDETSQNCSADCGSPVVITEDDGDTVPQTGLFDTVISKISLGLSFIFLGGLVSQYSRINYLFNSISEKNQFRRDIRKEKRNIKRREKLERRFK